MQGLFIAVLCLWLAACSALSPALSTLPFKRELQTQIVFEYNSQCTPVRDDYWNGWYRPIYFNEDF